MNDKVPTRPAGTIIFMLMLLGSIAAVNSAAGEDANWQQHGWDESELRNKVEHGDVTTYELGTPNYQILNPEDEPEYITEDQPQYREMLRRLTSFANATDTIDVDMPSERFSASVNATAVEETQPTTKWEKLKKRSFAEPTAEQEDQDEVEAVPVDERTRHPRVQVYAGARPFQKRIANLS